MPNTYAEQRQRQQQIDNLNTEINDLLRRLQDIDSDQYQLPIQELKYIHDDNIDRREKELSDRDINLQRNKFELIKVNCEIIKLIDLTKQANDTKLTTELYEILKQNDNLITDITHLTDKQFNERLDDLNSQISTNIRYKLMDMNRGGSTDENNKEVTNNGTDDVKHTLATLKTTFVSPSMGLVTKGSYAVPSDNLNDKHFRIRAQELQFAQYRLFAQLLITLNEYEAEIIKNPTSSQIPLTDIVHITPYLNFMAIENNPEKMSERLVLCELALLDIALYRIDKIINDELKRINQKNDPADKPRKELLEKYRKHFADEKVKVVNLITHPENITSSSDATPDKIRSNIQFYINSMMSEKSAVNNASYFSRVINSLVSIINHITPFKFERPFKTLSSEIRTTIAAPLAANASAKQFSYSEFINNNPQEPYPRSVFVANFLNQHPAAQKVLSNRSEPDKSRMLDLLPNDFLKNDINSIYKMLREAAENDLQLAGIEKNAGQDLAEVTPALRQAKISHYERARALIIENIMRDIYKNPELIDNVARQQDIDPLVFKINLEQAVNIYIDGPLSSLELRNQRGHQYPPEFLDIVNAQYQANDRDKRELSVFIKEINLTIDRLSKENSTLYKKEITQLEALANSASDLYRVPRPDLSTVKNKLALIQANVDLVKLSFSLPQNIKRVIIGLDELIIANSRTIEGDAITAALLKARLQASNTQLATIIGTIPGTLLEMAYKNEYVDIFYKNLVPAITTLYNNIREMPGQTTATYHHIHELLVLQNQLVLNMVEVCNNYYEMVQQGKSADSELLELNKVTLYIDHLNINTDPTTFFDQKNQCELALLTIGLDKIISELTSEIQKRQALIDSTKGGYAEVEEREALNELKSMLEKVQSKSHEYRTNPALITLHSTKLLRQDVDNAFNSYMSNPLVKRISRLSTIGREMMSINNKLKPQTASSFETIYTEPPQRPAYPSQQAPVLPVVASDVAGGRLSQNGDVSQTMPATSPALSQTSPPRPASSAPPTRPAPLPPEVSRLAATTPPPRPTSPVPPLPPNARRGAAVKAAISHMPVPAKDDAANTTSLSRPTSPAPQRQPLVNTASASMSSTGNKPLGVAGVSAPLPPPIVAAPGTLPVMPTNIVLPPPPSTLSTDHKPSAVKGAASASLPPPPVVTPDKLAEMSAHGILPPPPSVPATVTPQLQTVGGRDSRTETLPVVVEPVQAKQPLTKAQLLEQNRQCNDEFGNLISKLNKENRELYQERINLLKACRDKGKKIDKNSIDEEFVNSQRNKLELLKLDCELIALSQNVNINSTTLKELFYQNILLENQSIEKPDDLLTNEAFAAQQDQILSRLEQLMKDKYLQISSIFFQHERAIQALTKLHGQDRSENFIRELIATAPKLDQDTVEQTTAPATAVPIIEDESTLARNRQDLRLLQARIYLYLENKAINYDSELENNATQKQDFVAHQSLLFEKLLPLLHLPNNPQRIQALIPKCELALLGFALTDINAEFEAAVKNIDSKKDAHAAEKLDLLAVYQARFKSIEKEINRLLTSQTDVNHEMVLAQYHKIQQLKNNFKNEELVRRRPKGLENIIKNIDIMIHDQLPLNFPHATESLMELTQGSQRGLFAPQKEAIDHTALTQYRKSLLEFIDKIRTSKSFLEQENPHLYSTQIDELNKMIQECSKKRTSADIDTQFIRAQMKRLETIQIDYSILRVVGEKGKNDENISYVLGVGEDGYSVITDGIQMRMSTLLHSMAYSGISGPININEGPSFLFMLSQQRPNIDALYEQTIKPNPSEPHYLKHRYELALLQYQLVNHMDKMVNEYKERSLKNNQEKEPPELKMLTPFIELLKTTGNDKAIVQRIGLCELALRQIALHQAIDTIDKEIEPLTTSRNPEKIAQQKVLEDLRAILDGEYTYIHNNLAPMLRMLSEDKSIPDHNIQHALNESGASIQRALESFSQKSAVQKAPEKYQSILNSIVSFLNAVTPFNIPRFKSPLERVEKTVHTLMPDLKPQGPNPTSR